ncbi:glycosyltransferase [Flavobacterium sp.]|uniref:glycosyltransferase n=1 Tax=Flavobacterium sp. TaxID=239 RepID=UPI003751AC0B
MKKEILFICNNLNCGGAEKALISLLQSIDYSKYNVDLFVFRHEGVFFENVPKEVTILKEEKIVSYLYSSTKSALSRAIKNLNFKAIYLRIALFFLSKKYKSGVIIEQYFWKHYAKALPKLNKSYDVAIGFQEKNPIYFCVDKVTASLKIGWIHTDLEKLEIDLDNELYYFDKLNYITTVSDGLSDRLKMKLPQFASKITTIENIISSRIINDLSKEAINFKFDNDYFNIIYVGRIAQEKGLFMGLEAVTLLVKKGFKIRWYLIGEGNQKEQLIDIANKNNVANSLFFLGLKSNPYPYILNADCFLLPSFYEGKSISLEEAKLLHKPIVITNFSSAQDQIKDGFTGLIAAMDANAIASKLEQLISDEKLQLSFKDNLKNSVIGTEQEVLKFYNLINNGQS